MNLTKHRAPVSDLTIDRLPPHAPEAETAFLGCILNDPVHAIADAITLGAASDWLYDVRHQRLFDVIAAMVDDSVKVDIVTLCQKLKDLGVLAEVGGFTYLSTLIDAAPSAENLPYYLDILKEKYLARKAVQTCTEIISAAYESQDINTVLDQAEGSILSIRQIGGRREALTMRELMRQVVHNIEERKLGKVGLETGFLDLDKETNGGLMPADMWIIAARPSCGKTSLALNIAENVARKFLESWRTTSPDPGAPYGGESAVVFSLEMTAEALAERSLASVSRVNTRTKELDASEFPKLTAGTHLLAHLPLIIDDTVPMSVSGLRARARRYYSKNKARLFVVDYLQLIASEPGSREENRRVQVDAISRGLKSLAKELRVPILVLAQLNRDIEKDGKFRKPRMSDLRESGQIEQDADLIGFLYPDPSDIDENGDPKQSDCQSIFLRIGKQRNGRKEFDIPLVFLPKITRFESAAKV